MTHNNNSPARRALVTGGSGVIGAAICRALARTGVHVIVHAHHGQARAQQLAQDIATEGGSASVTVFDIADDQQVAQAMQSLLETGPIQILVNNAGAHQDALMAGMGIETWHAVINTNLNGFYRVTQPLLLPMIRTRWGRIINISSVAGIIGNKGQTNYAAAKAGLHGASKSLALEVASRGVTVNVVAPGVIDTGMSQEAFPPERIKEMIPSGRKGQPEEVASLVTYLASDQASYITGQVISISGGLC